TTFTPSLLPPVKSVLVYRNGDPFYSGRRFVVNQRQVTTMEVFLNEVTQSIGARLAVRTLYTPRQGHRVTDLQQLQTGAQYVAAGSERFKKLDVFRNGDLLCPPFRFIIPRTMLQDLEQVLSLVTEKVNLRTGAVRRLCSMEGVAVSSAAELETGHCYVAVGTERFKKLPYVELLVSKATERYSGSGPDDQYSDSALLESPESDGRRVKSTGDEAAASQKNRRQAAELTSAFFAKPVKIRKNRVKTRPDQPSVFKRAARKRREEVRGAVEVQEDENTATEIPVDQRVAETVEAEELNDTQDSRLHGSQQVNFHFYLKTNTGREKRFRAKV
uniref:Doublecortin domain-containing protein 2-like n=1 Tax=Gouania willdenowi TaxID=441366 RepID=A0A8C5GIR9_GOUWI